jgi:sigma-B regulation protein RsbU (phosphoserine phosphatase)
MKPGTRLVFYSDGIGEAENRLREEYGSTRLLDFAKSSGISPDLLLDDVSAFTGWGTFADDATVVLIDSRA